MPEAIPGSRYDGGVPSAIFFQEVTTIRRVEVAKEVYVGYVLLNQHLLGTSSPVVAPGGFMSDITQPQRAYEGA